MVERLTKSDSLRDSRFLRACRREPVDATPIWLMRQAGRYMPEYRALRQRYGILDIIKQPELALEVTLQPINAFDLDAAIIFADILPLLEGMGLDLEFVRGEGPLIHNPVRTAEDVAQLANRPPEEALTFTLEAIRLARTELDARQIPLIGFSGAPFTLACYAIEGGASRNHARTKSLMFGNPALWHELMTKLTDAAARYLVAQVEAGAHAVQLFDSWCGELSPADYRDCLLPHMKHLVATVRAAGVPVILFGVGTSGLLDLLRETGADVIGVDWRIDLGQAWERLGSSVAIQGNLDPITLFAPWEAIQPRAKAVLDAAAGRPGHIFNLGHGILPETPIDHVKRLCEYVHDASTASA